MSQNVTNSENTVIDARMAIAAELLANPDFSGTKSDIAEKAGVTSRTLYRWLRNPDFVALVNQLVAQYADAELAMVCLQTIRGKQFEYPVAFDIEEARCLPQADALCTAFCTALENAGYYTAIYTFKSALESNFSAAVKNRYDIFLSHIGVQQTDYAGSYGLWQYSWTGCIPGISGDVDLDYAYKDYPTMIQNAGLNGFTKATQTTEPDTEESTLKQILKHVASLDAKL